jgi:aryl-alcohol dehydrogenase-like predicted oxidoreductase
VALAWLLAKGDCITPVSGAKRVCRMEENTAADTIKLNADQIDKPNNLPPAVCQRYEDCHRAWIES